MSAMALHKPAVAEFSVIHDYETDTPDLYIKGADGRKVKLSFAEASDLMGFLADLSGVKIVKKAIGE